MRHLLSMTVGVLSVTAVLAVPLVAAAPSNAAIHGVPLCDGQNGRPAHQPTQWHPLVARNPNGSILCTYGHEHGMDPAVGDSVFGALPLAQTISYPWATVSPTGVLENGPLNKHRVYKWLVAPSLPCSLHDSPDGSSKMVTALREELHADGSLGATVRYHSFWSQYRLTDCATGEQGWISIGGHEDYAHLRVGKPAIVVPLTGDPASSCLLNGDSRQEGRLGAKEQAASVWYGSNSRPTLTGRKPTCDDDPGSGPHVVVQLNVTTNNFGPVDPTNPTAVFLYPGSGNHSGTSITSDALTIWISGFPTDASGHINFTGHTDQHGVVVPEVAGKPEGLDYIPLVIRNAKPRSYGANAAGGGNLQRHPISYDGDVRGPSGQRGYYVELPTGQVIGGGGGSGAGGSGAGGSGAGADGGEDR